VTERFVYHGSNIIVDKPKILTNGFFKDFGYGFYCTNLEKQAKRWAMTRRNNHIVNVYKLKELDAFNKLIFDSMNEDWLNFIVNCRRGLEHNYDVVEGPMADDTIWNFIEDYIGGDISKEAFWELVKFRYPTHQIVFCNEKALQAVIFERAYSL
jgi:hypothetical protein